MSVLPAGVSGVSRTDEGGDSFDSIGQRVGGEMYREGGRRDVCTKQSIGKSKRKMTLI